MRLTIVNSGAPGTGSVLAPFFEAVAEEPGVELVVLEQTPARECSRVAAGPVPCGRYRLFRLPTYCYQRRHACAQVLAPGYRRLLAASQPHVIYVLGEPGYLSTFQVMRSAWHWLPQTKLCLLAAQNVYQRFPPPFPLMERHVLAHLDHAFVLGRDHEQVLRRKGYRGPATPLPLGVDIQTFAPDGPRLLPGRLHLQRPVVGYVGDFLPARNLPLLIEAVSQRRSPVGLLLVGDGATRPRLESLASRRGLDGKAKFVGRVPHAQVPAYLNAMDIFVLPSKPVRNRCFGLFHIANAEQFGRVLVEAMACGKPVVGSSCGEIPHVIGNAGRVFPEGDVAALARVLDELCSDLSLREQLGQRGLARARAHYDWRVIAARFLAEVQKMLAPVPAGPPRVGRACLRPPPAPRGTEAWAREKVGAGGRAAR